MFDRLCPFPDAEWEGEGLYGNVRIARLADCIFSRRRSTCIALHSLA